MDFDYEAAKMALLVIGSFVGVAWIWYLYASRAEERSARARSVESVEELRASLNALCALNPRIEGAFNTEESKSTSSGWWYVDPYRVPAPPVNTVYLAKLWEDLQSEQTDNGRKARIEKARKALS